MSIQLKVKAKSLAVEAQIIRKEERKLIKSARWTMRFKGLHDANIIRDQYESVHLHRVREVRQESRATHLARAYLVSMPYSKVESGRKETREYKFMTHTLSRTLKLIKRYGNYETYHHTTYDDLLKWVDA